MKEDLNDRSWPFPAVQAMKSIRDRPTAVCDPVRSFMVVAVSVGL